MYLDTTELSKLSKEYDYYSEQRQQLHELAGRILNLSKKIIYSIHREDFKSAQNIRKELKKKIALLAKLTRTNPKLLEEGIHSSAMQEYCEAICFLDFVKKGKIPGPKQMAVNSEDYLLALSDLTGELSRRAVHLAIKHKMKDVQKIYDAINEIHAFFLEFNLRNSELRKKADSIKWNLKKAEEILYSESTRAKK